MADYSRGNEGWARGDVLVQLRRQRHLTQQQASSGMGVTEKSLRKWEHGGTMEWPSAEQAARFYKVTPETIFAAEPSHNGSSPLAGGELIRLERLEPKVEQILQVTESVAAELARLRRLVEELARRPPGQDPPPDAAGAS